MENRLTSLITRRVGRMAPYAPLPPAVPATIPGSEDLRLFLTAWLGGLVFFGTFLM